MSRNSCRGQATVETALALVFVIIPLTFGLIAFSELAWTYHALATLTRQGAHYAATHCWQDDIGSNVLTWMQGNAPLQNQDLERAVMRSAILADLFCLFELLPDANEFTFRVREKARF